MNRESFFTQFTKGRKKLVEIGTVFPVFPLSVIFALFTARNVLASALADYSNIRGSQSVKYFRPGLLDTQSILLKVF